MQKISLLILDFDGTIVDTREGILTTFREALCALGKDLKPGTCVENLIGLPLSTMFKEAASLEDGIVEEAVREYRRRYRENAPRTATLFPGVAETLESLCESGFSLAVATNKSREGIDSIIDCLDVRRYFSEILCPDDVADPKPAPEMVHRIMESRKLTSAETLVIGDTTIDMAMGKAAECFTCAVTYGIHSREQLCAVSPDFVIDAFPQLMNIVFYE